MISLNYLQRRQSIRVGTYVKIYESGIGAETIKIRLRWKSDVFRAYLRNGIAIAKKYREILRSQWIYILGKLLGDLMGNHLEKNYMNY